MKAVRFHQHGGPEVLKYEDIPTPTPGAGEILLKIKAISVNHLDIWQRKGLPGMKIPLPHICGADAAGTIEAVGTGVTSVKSGQRVLVNPSFQCGKCEFCAAGNGSMCMTYEILGEHRAGTNADYIVLPHDQVIPIPENLSFELAAAAPLAYLTAWTMLVTRAQIKPSDDVLILGAGAGVGTACIQIAKMIGARVFATASTEEKLEKAKKLGADVLINYAKEDFAKKVRELTNKRGVDVVIDYIGADTWVKSLQSLRRGGKLVTCGATTGYDPKEDLRHIFFRQLTILGSTMGSHKDLRDVLKCVFDGRLKPVIDRTLPLKDAAEAHRLIEARVPFGKLILIP